MPETELQALLPFPAQPLERLGELARRLPYRLLNLMCYYINYLLFLYFTQFGGRSYCWNLDKIRDTAPLRTNEGFVNTKSDAMF